MASCCHCGACCTKAPCLYGQHRYHCKPGFPCPGLTSKNFCRVYLEADEDLRAEMEDVMGVGIGAGCCSPMFNTMREAALKKRAKKNPYPDSPEVGTRLVPNAGKPPKENPPLRIRDLTSLIDLCDAYFEVSILPWYSVSTGDGLHLYMQPFEPYDVEIILRATTLPQGITLPQLRQYSAGAFTAHYVCTDDLDAPLYHGTSGLTPNFQRKGFSILAYLGLMEVLALFGGWLGVESRFGGMTSDDAWRSWLYLQNLDEVFYRQVDFCSDYDPHGEYQIDAPMRVWQYVGPRVLGGLIPARIGRHSTIEVEGVATGRKTMLQFNSVLRQWIEGGV